MTSVLILFVFVSLIFLKTECRQEESANDDDDTCRAELNCKVSHTGVEYAGCTKHTESNILCKHWDENFLHSPDLDDDFVDGSKFNAKNYCRNPKEKFSDPWCYSTDPNVINDVCSVPLCSFECRKTVAGCEYKGNVNTTISHRKCIKWSEKAFRQYESKAGIKTSHRALSDNKFPDGSRKKAKDQCRNPTADINGPWCLVENKTSGKIMYEKEYCNIELCSINTTECSFATSSSQQSIIHNHFIRLPNENDSTFQASVLLWNLGDFNKATYRIAFTTLPVLLSGENLIKMDTGVELFVNSSHVTFVSYQNESWIQPIRVVKVLSGASSQTFRFLWVPQEYYIEVNFGKHTQSANYGVASVTPSNATLLSIRKGVFSYYSILGNAAVWSVQCSQPQVCEEHVTLSANCSIYKKMKLKNETENLSMVNEFAVDFFVRSKTTVIIELRNSPVAKFPYFRIEILGAFNKTTLQIVENVDSLPTYLGVVTYNAILSMWTWAEFTLSIVGDRLHLIWFRQLVTPETLFDVVHPLFRNALWFSFCSVSTAIWAFSCSQQYLPPIATPENNECSRSPNAIDYVGTQWTTHTGRSCLPWIYPSVVHQVGEVFIEFLNFCRNPNDDPAGAFCYVARPEAFPALAVEKEYCDVPQCPLAECRLSGTGHEYAGSVNTTRSGRQCIDSALMNLNSSHVGFCRNPNQNIFGPWCNTTDPRKKTELCDIKDCDVDDSCTIIINSHLRLGRRILVNPEWMVHKFNFKVKIWDPTTDNGIKINMFVHDPKEAYFFSLTLGAGNFNAVELAYVRYNNRTLVQRDSVILKTKIVPRLIPKGYWQAFWLKLPPYNIELGYGGSENSIVSWVKPYDEDLPANVIISEHARVQFISLTTLEETKPTSVGFSFPCDSCLVEKATTFVENAFYPINLWLQSRSPGYFTIHLRTNDIFDKPVKPQSLDSRTAISFYEDVATESRLVLILNYTYIVLAADYAGFTVYTSLRTPEPLLRHNRWTSFRIGFTESSIKVEYQLGELLSYNFTSMEPFTLYYFTVLGIGEVPTWVVNCDPPELDVMSVDGGWGEWSDFVCNVPCGGGIGFRTRECDKPKPSFLGYPCLGSPTEDGPCNQYECGCLNPVTVARTNRALLARTENLRVKESENVVMYCPRDILQQAKNDSSKSKMQWLKDGFKLPNTRLELQNMKSTSDSNLEIKFSKEADTGIYTCVIYPDCTTEGSDFVTVSVAALVVETSEPRYIRITRNLKLTCNSAALENVYKNVSQSWYLDGVLYLDYTSTKLDDANNEIVEDVQPYHEGVWECRVEDRSTKLIWITNRVAIDVLGRPTELTYFSEDDAPSILFAGWNVTLIVVFLVTVTVLDIVAVVYVVYWFRNSRNEMLGK